jgi:formylmethanofuran dehydrogenase subunit B
MTGASEQRIAMATCLGCGCTCDDIVVTARGGRIVGTERACPLGVEWFGDGASPRAARLDGREVEPQRAILEAVRLLAAAQRPLVYLASDVSCEAQREGIAIADALRAVVDHATSTSGLESVLAAQERGRASATLGEIKNRADLLIFWGVDPRTHYPRFQERYGADAIGEFVAGGRRSRRVVAVDVGGATGPQDADDRIAVAAGEETALLEALRSGVTDFAAFRQDGPWRQVVDLQAAIARAAYMVVVADGTGPQDAARHELLNPAVAARAQGLIAFTQASNRATRCSLVLLRGGGNAQGAEICLTSQTGYPVAVDFGRGYPRYRPFDGGAVDLISRGEIDAVLVIGSDRLPAAVLDQLRTVRHRIVVGPRASTGALRDSLVVLDGGLIGVDEPGLVYRMDDVPISVRPVIVGGRSTASLVGDLRVQVLRERA